MAGDMAPLGPILITGETEGNSRKVSFQPIFKQNLRSLLLFCNYLIDNPGGLTSSSCGGLQPLAEAFFAISQNLSYFIIYLLKTLGVYLLVEFIRDCKFSRLFMYLKRAPAVPFLGVVCPGDMADQGVAFLAF